MKESGEKLNYHGMGMWNRPEDEVLPDGKIVLKNRQVFPGLFKDSEIIDIVEDQGKKKARIIEIKYRDNGIGDITVEML